MQSRSGKQTSLFPISPSPLVASQEAWPRTVVPTSVDCGFQSHCITSIECLHEYARRFGRYPKLGLFTTDIEEIAGPFSTGSIPPSPSMPTDITFIFSSTDNALKDTEDDEYLPTRRTTRLRKPAYLLQASSSRVPTELPANTRRRKRDDSPDVEEEAKRHKSDTGDPGASTPRPPTSTTHETEIDPKTGKQFIVVRDKKGKVLKYRCPDHPDLNCSNRGDMGRHLQSRDHQQPSFCCVGSCGRKFTRLDALKRHVSNTNLHPKGSLVVVVVDETGAETHFAEDGRGRKRQ